LRHRADMYNRRILVLAPWPFRKPQNGGQLRCAAVAQAYRDAGHVVHTTAFYDANRTRPDEIWSGDVPITPGVGKAMQEAPAGTAASGLAFWEAVAAADDSFAAFAAAAQEFKPDVLQFEEPFLWPVVRRLRAEGLLDNVLLVHSSYNFETAAWLDLQTAGAVVDTLTLRDIAALEKEIAISCDLIITVSESDAREFYALGAAKVCVAGNGTAELHPQRTTRVLDAYRPSGMPHALFVSSAHPPNAHGLVELAAAASGNPIRDGEIFICGQVGPLIRSARHFRQATAVLDRARYLGWVDNGLRDALYSSARVVILPKTLGGGSNLKTAEALASGRPIVATSIAFRGFEAFAELPGITISDDADKFWAAVNAHFSNDALAPPRSAEALTGLLWSECLKPMVWAVSPLGRVGNNATITAA
jgi:glycosyltransferase involved in cell wall biosynthesis